MVLLIDTKGILTGDSVVETHLRLKTRMSPWRRRLDKAGAHAQFVLEKLDQPPARRKTCEKSAETSVSYEKTRMPQFV